MSERILFEVPLTLTVAAPFMTKASDPGRWSMDAVIARVRHGPNKGKPYIAGTLVTGRLREAWDHMRPLAAKARDFDPKADEWLGAKSRDFRPARKRLVIPDMIAEVTAESANSIQRIKIDRARGAVEKGAIQIIEQAAISGSSLRFSGRVQLYAEAREAKTILRHLRAGLVWLTNLGAFRGVGFGRLRSVELGPLAPVASESPPAVDPSGFGMTLALDRPLCVAGRHIADNLFESAEVLPGSVLKGALAQTWAHRLGKSDTSVDAEFDPARPALSEHFSQVRFLHAFPSQDAARRPVQWPNSLVQAPLTAARPDGIYDVALCPVPRLIEGEAPRFQIDWKSGWDDIARRYGWQMTHRELRVRTAISATTRRADERKLFAYELTAPQIEERDPSDPDRTGVKDVAWVSSVDLSLVPFAKQAEVAAQLADLLAGGISYIGKTKARATLQLSARPQARSISADPSLPENCWIVTLQTPALLCDPDSLDQSSGAASLRQAYAAVWTDLSDNSLRLVRYFARQALSGGAYQHSRFRQGAAYEPFMITEAGSVFILESTGSGDPTQKLSQWERHGLPLPEWVRRRYGANGDRWSLWKTCPFLPENGFGEIALNLPDHVHRKPPQARHEGGAQ